MYLSTTLARTLCRRMRMIQQHSAASRMPNSNGVYKLAFKPPKSKQTTSRDKIAPTNQIKPNIKIEAPTTVANPSYPKFTTTRLAAQTPAKTGPVKSSTQSRTNIPVQATTNKTLYKVQSTKSTQFKTNLSPSATAAAQTKTPSSAITTAQTKTPSSARAIAAAPKADPKAAPVAITSPVEEEQDEYLEAIKCLNSLQAPEEHVKRAHSQSEQVCNISDTISWLELSGLSLKDLGKIPMLRITGSKGRGSTGAILDSILRAYGVRTGFFSSPHMILTTERIRINGTPINKKKFTNAFWDVYNQLKKSVSTNSYIAIPGYYKFMTILAFHIFVREKVDVAVLEVGPAGASDSTNILHNCKTIGICSLGMEEAADLSKSMRDIAWNKASIMKKNANVYTSVTQPECLEVLALRAKELKANLHKVPKINEYIDDDYNTKRMLNSANYMIRLNGSLAIQLAYGWMNEHQRNVTTQFEPNSIKISPQVIKGISQLQLPGHCELIKYDIFNVHLDCADTLESMLVCRDWFYNQTRINRTPKILLFNKVNEFNAKDLLLILRSKIRFEEAFFVPNPCVLEGQKLTDEEDAKAIAWHGMEDLQRAKQNASSWRALCEETAQKDNSHLTISIDSFFEYLQTNYGGNKYGMRRQVDVLVTGSSQLVGATICALQSLKSGGKSHT